MLTAQDLLHLACNLTASLAAEDRYRRLLDVVQRVIPCQSAALLRCDGDALVPLAFTGLVPELAGRRLVVKDHPRLDQILHHRGSDGSPGNPLRFPADCPLADPYDGLMLGDTKALARIHACMGCPLIIGAEVIGVLTVDSLDPHAFDQLSDDTVATLAAIAAASLHTAGLIDALEQTSRRRDTVLKHLVHDDRDRRGAQLLGTSEAVKALRREIDLVAQSDLIVLITGETGVGKELVAASIHAASRRSEEPLIQVNCAAMPESIAESELFGHVRGAFTGAIADRAGKFEIADGGTLFLDEIGELPLSIQAKLLRALQQGEIQRVGSDRVLKVDVRVIAATNRDLDRELASGRFRPDLYHRLSVYPLHVAPLRDHRDDVPLLAGHIFDRESLRLGVAGARLDADARRALMEYPWPGNVRELEHVLMRALLRASARGARGSPVVITAAHLGLGAMLPPDRDTPPATSTSERSASLRQRIDAFTRSEIESCMQRHRGVWAAAGRELQLSPSNLQRVARRLGIGTGS